MNQVPPKFIHATSGKLYLPLQIMARLKRNWILSKYGRLLANSAGVVCNVGDHFILKFSPSTSTSTVMSLADAWSRPIIWYSMHLLQPSRLVRIWENVCQCEHYEEINLLTAASLTFTFVSIIAKSIPAPPEKKISLEKHTRKKKANKKSLAQIKQSIITSGGEDWAQGETMQIPSHLLQLPLRLANFKWSGLSSLNEHSPYLTIVAAPLAPSLFLHPHCITSKPSFPSAGFLFWPRLHLASSLCHTSYDSTHRKKCSWISVVAATCAQITQVKVKCGKQNRRPRDFNEKGNPFSLNSWGQTGVCTRVFAWVAGKSCGVCRPVEARSFSSSSSDANLHIGFSMRLLAAFSGPSKIHERGNFCGSWLLSHSSSTSPAPKDCSAWIIQPTRIVNESFVITNPPRGPPS